jgi:hypothetical protein
MSSISEENAGMNQIEENIDELQKDFDDLDGSERPHGQKLQDYIMLLQNPRFDDVAVKVKEQCIYRFVETLTKAQMLKLR